MKMPIVGRRSIQNAVRAIEGLLQPVCAMEQGLGTELALLALSIGIPATSVAIWAFGIKSCWGGSC